MRRPEADFVTPTGLDTALQLGRAVKAARLAMNSTQADFSARARVSRATLARIEAGDPAVSFGSWLSALEEGSLLHLLKKDGGGFGPVRAIKRQRASGSHGEATRKHAYDF